MEKLILHLINLITIVFKIIPVFNNLFKHIHCYSNMTNYDKSKYDTQNKLTYKMKNKKLIYMLF